MQKKLVTYTLVLILLLVIDAIWLSAIARNFYSDRLHFLLATEVNWAAAVPFYLIYALGLMTFVVTPCKSDPDLHRAISLGSLFGLVAYSTYDLTNWAIIEDWPPIVTFVDLTWGALLSAGVGAISVYVLRNVYPKQETDTLGD